MKLKKKKLLRFLFRKDYKPMTFESLQRALRINSDREIQELYRLLGSLEKSGSVIKTAQGRYSPLGGMGILVGKIERHVAGYAFLLPEAPGEADVFIPSEKMGSAVHGDKVMVRLLAGPPGGHRRRGEIIRIIQRGNENMVGTYLRRRHQGLVLPDDRHFSQNIKIKGTGLLPVQKGDKVLVKITRWPEGPQGNIYGEIAEVIGPAKGPGVDITSIQRKYEIPSAFPARVLQEASRIGEIQMARAMQEEERLKLQDLPVITIDDADAQDLDDAVSLQRTKEGGYSLGVHLADVSFYVREGSALDREAAQRGTSVYLPDRVIPMLPPELTSGVCSLNPQAERLAISVFLELSPKGELQNYRFHPSVICCTNRITYEEVNGILKGQEDLRKKYTHLEIMLKEMAEVAGKLKEKRIKQGALDFNFPEARVKLDRQGKPLEVQVKGGGVSESIIEEFMLLCNKVIAVHFYRLQVPFLYRVHERPEVDKLSLLRDFLILFDIKLKGDLSKITARQFQKIMARVKGSPAEKIVNYVLLRSLPQARYSEQPLGHFGLATRYYSHFTAPIRRYPDLLAHRLLRASLKGRMPKSQARKLISNLPRLAEHLSRRERIALEAERECLDLKKVEFMEGQEGLKFTGTISGVTSFGFFVELSNTVEGLVHVTDLVDDYYYFEEKNYCLVGERTRKKYQLGDLVHVQLQKADKMLRTINFIPC